MGQVWAKGVVAEHDVFLGFRTSIDVKEGEKSLLRVTGDDAFRLSLDDEHIGWLRQ